MLAWLGAPQQVAPYRSLHRALHSGERIHSPSNQWASDGAQLGDTIAGVPEGLQKGAAQSPVFELAAGSGFENWKKSATLDGTDFFLPKESLLRLRTPSGWRRRSRHARREVTSLVCLVSILSSCLYFSHEVPRLYRSMKLRSRRRVALDEIIFVLIVLAWSAAIVLLYVEQEWHHSFSPNVFAKGLSAPQIHSRKIWGEMWKIHYRREEVQYLADRERERGKFSLFQNSPLFRNSQLVSYPPCGSFRLRTKTNDQTPAVLPPFCCRHSSVQNDGYITIPFAKPLCIAILASICTR